MVVDHRVGGAQLDRALQLAQRLRIAAEAVIGPAQRIDDVAVARAEFDGTAQHLQRLVELEMLIDQRITEIVQHQRALAPQRLGQEFERLAQIGLGLRPALDALAGDAAEVEQVPVGAAGRGELGDRLVVGGGGLLEHLARTIDIAERRERIDVVRPLGDQGVEVLHRLLGPAQIFQRETGLDLGIGPKRRGRWHLLVDGNGVLGLARALEDVAQRQDRKVVVGVEVDGKAQIEQRRGLVALAVAGTGEAVKHLGGALLGVADLTGRRLPGRHLGQAIADDRVVRQQAIELRIGRGRALEIAVAGLHLRPEIDEPQRRLLRFIGGLQALLGIGLAACRVEDEAGVIVAKEVVGGLAAQPFQRLDGARGLP